MIDRSAVRALAALIGVSLLAVGADSSAQTKTVRITAATAVLDVTYPTMTLPNALGYWKQEGYEVEAAPAGGSLQAVQQLVGGNADFAAASGGAIVSGNGKSNLGMKVVSSISASDWALAVDADGPIKSVNDLKGKTIGVFNLATGGIAFLNGLLRANGMDPAKDIQMVALGMGVAPVEAMRSGKVQGLIYWGSAIASFENAGLKFRKIVGNDWQVYPEYTLTTLKATADKDPAMLIGIARGIVKAQVFAVANPECAVKIHWSHTKAARPQGVDEATFMKRELHSLEANLASNISAFKQYGGGKVWGAYDPSAWKKLADFMLQAKQIEALYDTAQLPIAVPDFVRKINDFDKEAIGASAKACKF